MQRSLVLCVAAAMLAGCGTSLNPYANPGRAELDRMQKIINGRPDLEAVQHQLVDLDVAIRAAIAKYAPQVRFSSTRTSQQSNGCPDPFTRNIGRQERSDHFFGEPGPSAQQWAAVVAELAPTFAAAGFQRADSGAGNDSQLRYDGALINLVNHGHLIDYNYDTGCHLPAAWRSAPPPAQLRPANDPGVHYPYLYEPPGGRSVDAL